MSRFLAAISLVLLAGCARSSATTAPAMETSATAPVYVRPTTAELKARLTPLQFEVTQNAATEPPFRNAYWDNHADGIYVDVVSGVPLFSSRDKFESGTGWPSFSRTIARDVVVESVDTSHGMHRIEAVSKVAGSHLGHVFDDGPPPTGKRYCMNSASLRFIPAGRLAAEGYADYAKSFSMNAEPAMDSAPVVATKNACALPPPGEKPGCSATLEVAVFTNVGEDRKPSPAGVLEIVRGHAGGSPAVEVTFDPAKISHAEVVRTWTKTRSGVLADASSFRRD